MCIRDSQKIMFRKVLATLVVICVFIMLVLITTAVVVTLLNSRARRINATIVDEPTFSSSFTEAMSVRGDQFTTETHSNVSFVSLHVSKQTPDKHHTVASRTTKTVAATTTITAGTTTTSLESTLHSSTVSTSTETTSTPFITCLLYTSRCV